MAKAITYTLTVNGTAASAAVLNAVKQIEVEDHAAMADACLVLYETTFDCRILPTELVFSRDGSRMAVFTDDGIYLYDVPAEFR